MPALLLGPIPVPMRPEELENLMHSMNQQQIVVSIPEENETADTDFLSRPMERSEWALLLLYETAVAFEKLK